MAARTWGPKAEARRAAQAAWEAERRTFTRTPAQAAKQLGVTRQTILTWLKYGKLAGASTAAGWRTSDAAIAEYTAQQPAVTAAWRPQPQWRDPEDLLLAREKFAALERDDWICQCCGRDLRDLPTSRYGVTFDLVTACASCIRRKGSRTAAEFRAATGSDGDDASALATEPPYAP